MMRTITAVILATVFTLTLSPSTIQKKGMR